MRLILLLMLTATSWAASAQRIVSTAPSITETLFAMGLGPKVVGVTIYCKFPAEALKLPKIGTYSKPDVEAIVALHPDLVVVQKQDNGLSGELDRIHLRYVEVQSHNLADIYAGARVIGQAADARPQAEKLVGDMQSELARLKMQTAKLPKPSTAFIVGHTPGTLEGLIVGSGTSYFSDLLNCAGGSNIFNDAATPYPKISLEEILSRNPDFILELSGESRPKQQEIISLWQSQQALRAVTSGHVVPIPSAPFLVPGPRAADAAQILVHILHPELPKSAKGSGARP